ncbi:DNA polymerase alpha catalytic subunit [Tetrabaena socialis]|uniref:DNA polymerase alpha catalytic subunit n=1 Tax=Tetrabaena socialis TaxID=47790 RepID=A0A2J7ZQ35_9CHLO|nr:DNA polymerase alpha catalytic subunit [Tetrabaena socialis]|eukprot:PNH02378.1 DNA polymerase alpha catalytic subunit [Tetrabaena socialis]
MERSRRQPVQSSAAAKTKGALEQLKAARAGAGKRALAYEVKEEDAVYDVVDDHQYAEIVKKRRDAGDFVVDDDGTGYVDIGEDDYWNQREEGAAEEEEEEGEEGGDGKPAAKKRKKDQAKGGAKRKGGAAEGEEGPARAEGGNITALFRKAAANRWVGWARLRCAAAVGGRGGWLR